MHKVLVNSLIDIFSVHFILFNLNIYYNYWTISTYNYNDLINNKLFQKGKYVVVGVSNIDIYTGKTSIFQFKEIYINNPTTYDELERFISIYNPSEVIIISNLSNKEVDDVISKLKEIE